MLLIHLSDIHLKSADYDSLTDENQLLRRKLEEDIHIKCSSLGKKPDAIILSGDIAFSAAPKEYQFAKEWLKSLCDTTGAEYSSVFVIPGNHDVNRSETSNQMNSLIIDKIRTFTSHSIEQDLVKLISDSQTSEALIKPLENYNEFAREFSCELDYARNLHAKRIIKINENYSVVLWGLNSVIASNILDSQSPANMYVIPSYRNILENDGEINIVACHHPYNWLANGEKFREHLSDTAKIILFGHEHNNRSTSTQDFLQVSASAVIPDSDGSGTQPGYNLINITIIDNDENNLIIDIYPREWQSNPPRFREKLTKAGEPFLRAKYKLKPKTKKNLNSENNIQSHVDMEEKTRIAKFVLTQVSESKITPLPFKKNERAVILSFMSLTISERREIAREVGVWEESFLRLCDKGASEKIIENVFKKEIMNEFSEAINKKESNK